MAQEQPINWKKSLGLFLGLSFGIAWLGYIIGWGCGYRYGDPAFDIVLGLGKLAPLAAALLTRHFHQEGFDPEALGIRPHLKKRVLTHLGAYFFPTALAALTGFLYYLAHPGQYDPMAEFFTQGLVAAGSTPEQAAATLNQALGMGVLAGPLVNLLFSLTELLGFMGYLLPKAVTLLGSRVKASLCCGAVWSVWRLPLLFDGYYYGWGYPGAPFWGVALGLVFGFLLGFVLSYLTLRGQSVWPAALAFSGTVAMAAAPVYFAGCDVRLIDGPVVYGLFGCLALLLLSGLFALRLRRL